MTKLLLFRGPTASHPATYEPMIIRGGVVWRRNDDYNPWVGVNVANMQQAAQVATPVRAEAFEAQEETL